MKAFARGQTGAETQQGWEAVALLLLPFLLISSLMRPGLPGMADAQIHLFRTVEWDYLWRNGILFPTWAPNLAFGYGYPLFNFAPPLPYIFIDLWHLLGLSLTSATKLLAVGTLYLASLGAYFFARRTLGFGPSLIVAAAQLYTPFVFRQHLLYGGNYPQLLGMALFPWGLWAVHRLLSTGRGSAVVWVALIVAAALQSHLFQGLLLVGLLAAYLILYQIRQPLTRRTLYAIVALLLGVALAGWFLFPVFIERGWTWTQSDFYVQKSPYSLRFLTVSELWAWPARLDLAAANPWVPFSLNPMLVGLAGLGLLTLPWQRRWSDRLFHAIFCLLVLVGSLFLMLPESTALWETFPFLSLAQFPWRLFGLPILATAFLAGLGVQLLFDRLAWLRASALKGGILLGLTFLLIVAPVAPLFYPTAGFVDFGSPTVADHLRFEMSGLVIGGTNLGEYLPVWVAEQPRSSPLVSAIEAGQIPDRLDRALLPAQAEVIQTSLTPLTFAYRLRLSAAQTLRFHAFYFPGWEARIDGAATPVFPEAESGLILLEAPAGIHWVEVRYRWPLYRWLSLAVTLAAIALLLSLGWPRAQRPAKPAETTGDTVRLARWMAFFLLLAVVVKVGFVDRQKDLLHLQSPPGEVIGTQHPLNVRFDEVPVQPPQPTPPHSREGSGSTPPPLWGRLGGGEQVLEGKVRLLGFDLDKTVYRPGDRLHIRLYWQAETPLDVDYTTFIHLDTLPPVETRATSDNEIPGDAQSQIDIPTRHWDLDTYVRDEHRIILPAELPPLVYQVRVGLYDPATGQRLAPAPEEGDVLATIYVVGEPETPPTIGNPNVYPTPPHSREGSGSTPPPLWGRLGGGAQLHPNLRVGDAIELTGYGFAGTEATRIVCSASALVGCLPDVTLHWRTDAAIAEDLVVLLHLLGADGKLYGQGDGPPANGRYPTSLWLPGQTIVDTHRLAVVSLPPPGEYRLITGLYRREGGERLPVTGKNGPLADGALPLDGLIVQIVE